MRSESSKSSGVVSAPRLGPKANAAGHPAPCQPHHPVHQPDDGKEGVHGLTHAHAHAHTRPHTALCCSTPAALAVAAARAPAAAPTQVCCVGLVWGDVQAEPRICGQLCAASLARFPAVLCCAVLRGARHTGSHSPSRYLLPLQHMQQAGRSMRRPPRWPSTSPATTLMPAGATTSTTALRQ